MDLHFRHRQEGERYDTGAVLAKHTVKLPEKLIAAFYLLMQYTPLYSPSKGSGMLLAFWQAPVPAGIYSAATSRVDMTSP